jgi:hypothetical protein
MTVLEEIVGLSSSEISGAAKVVNGGPPGHLSLQDEKPLETTLYGGDECGSVAAPPVVKSNGAGGDTHE